ncbi:Predicted O-methyltransferase YrrM [Desulfonispora thiosulfatigenes DSM 11270]|uniref:tRNA 5-hydroxyuridine methyltransferase n=1 Tax=Desulfonispora thiosulfatigenes DSM 11270 TaxID=656914 RepID=A0A1W1VQG0_DESTI|nr:O-methyltransferase [Desulfonispora thiosulfatigenes]SMB95588.1 Predicted O-methyltransferase YrrM [Desulfonispora thiosulfatigenes DSM 11270]
MKDVLDLDLQNFLRSLLPDRDALLHDMEVFANENHVSIVDPEVGQLLNLLVTMLQPTNILEIGTAIGYSTICMARALQKPDSKITTIELLPHRVLSARENFKKAGVSEKIEIINGDAKDVIHNLKDTYDFIFLDAAKGQYPLFLELADKLLKPNSLIVADNVLINGWVIDLKFPERRKKTMVHRMRNFLEELKNKDNFKSSIVPLGDGVALIWRKE